MKQARVSTLLVLAMAALPVFGQPYSDHPHYWGGGWGMIFMPLMMIIFIGAVIVVVVLVIRWLSGSSIGPITTEGNKALDILKERFARGEIDQKEFEERKKSLSD